MATTHPTASLTVEDSPLLSPELAAAYLAVLESTGCSLRRAARDVGVDRRQVYVTRYADAEFRSKLNAVRARRVQTAADELFAAIAAAREFLTDEQVLDELVNVVFNPVSEAPEHPELDCRWLAHVRERLVAAGARWAEAVENTVRQQREMNGGA